MQGLALKRGFTLIEVIWVGLIAAVLGFGIVSMLTWMFRVSKEDQTRAHLQTQANIVLEEIARHVHISSTVASVGTSLLLFYVNGAPSGSMAFTQDTLMQDGLPFLVAGLPVLVVGDSSFFNADTASSGEFVNTRLVLRRDNARFTLHTGILRCRN